MTSPIRVTYRAVFKSPLMGPLNPTGVPFAVSMTLEVYQAKASEWRVREMDTGKKRVLQLPSCLSSESLKAAVRVLFREQVTEWRMFADVPPYQFQPPGPRPLSDDEVEIREGKVYLKAKETESK